MTDKPTIVLTCGSCYHRVSLHTTQGCRSTYSLVLCSCRYTYAELINTAVDLFTVKAL